MFLLYEKVRHGRHDVPVEYPVAGYEVAQDAINEAANRNKKAGRKSAKWYFADSSNLPFYPHSDE